ncbi:MAG: hypothetical protein A2987_01405 [Omnitrophica bacterium RIFCSPLOWO2_01_FULL_45_10]|nr:MAG: hypothetical protein A2987_01405 [Omnitrophica bacterium RIFCSPLOWO2_01_FULL_45_10]
MKNVINVAIVIGVISLIASVISRVTMTPLGAVGIRANAILAFADTCFLIAITFILLEILKAKK